MSESAHDLTTRPLFEWKELTQTRAEKKKKKKKKKASHMADMYPQLLLKHLSNYRISCSSQNLTLSGRWLACVETFCSINALFTEKPISNSCRMISASSSRVTHSFSETLRQTDFEHYLTHTTEPTASSKWLGSMLRRGMWGAKGDQKPFTATKAFFLYHPRPRRAAGGTPLTFWLQLTLPTGMEILS